MVEGGGGRGDVWVRGGVCGRGRVGRGGRGGVGEGGWVVGHVGGCVGELGWGHRKGRKRKHGQNPE